MLGIAFIGGEGPNPVFAAETVKQARKAGPVLIAAADSGLIPAEAAGLSPDWIIGDMDSLAEKDAQSRLEKYPPERVRSYPRDKDYTDTELVLALLEEQGCEETWLVGGGGGRLDHLLAIRSLFERPRCPARWITSREDVHILTGPQSFAAKLKPGAMVSLLPLGEGPWDAESKGLKWPVAGLPWSRGFIAISNLALEGPFRVDLKRGRLMLITGLL
jgi:thiamine pyrophosphokinase